MFASIFTHFHKFKFQDSWDTFSCSLPRSPPPVTALNGLAQQTPRFSASLSRASSVTTQTGSDTTTTVTDVTAVPAAAVEDGFSPNEITEFAQLLCSPKKAPSIKYQCHICYQTGQHYISDCPLVSFIFGVKKGILRIISNNSASKLALQFFKRYIYIYHRFAPHKCSLYAYFVGICLIKNFISSVSTVRTKN